jgi:hypothetical protein
MEVNIDRFWISSRIYFTLKLVNTINSIAIAISHNLQFIIACI